MKSTQVQLSKEQFPRSKQSRGSEIPPPQQGVIMSTDTIEEIKIDEKIKQTISEPPKYKVVMINDDLTPMEWVVHVLTNIFLHSQTTAEQIMLQIHNDGSAIVGIYSYEIAEQKSIEVVNSSREKGFPLTVRIEIND